MLLARCVWSLFSSCDSPCFLCAHNSQMNPSFYLVAVGWSWQMLNCVVSFFPFQGFLCRCYNNNYHNSFILTCFITHTLVYFWGLLLAGGMTEKEIIRSLCCLSTFTWIFPAISAVHFLAFAYLAITFWSKELVIIGIEGLMSSGSVTNVTGTLFRMRNTFCWTVRINILLASAHSTASWSSLLNMKIAELV